MANVGALEQQPARTVTKKRSSRESSKISTYLVLILGMFFAICPFLWMFSASLMTNSEINFGRVLPATPMFENYALAWQRANFAQFMWNSARIAAITITGELLVCVPAAYAFARMKFYGKDALFGIMLATLMIPEIATLIPNYLTVIWLGRLSDNLLGFSWLNNWPALTIPFMASAFSIFLLRQFFLQIPEDLWDAARIDGVGHVRYLRSIVVPLSRAPIMTVITFAFIASWNSLLWPLLVVQTDEWRPVAFGLNKFVSADAPGDFNLQMAAAGIMVVPILIVYFITQRQFTEGIASTGLKG
jgi:ABC-type glycerol-3-phosphate transport system permease component